MTSQVFSVGRAGGMLANKGWTDEARAAALAVRREKAAARAAARKRVRARERDEMFEKQRERGGKDFIGNWYPAGDDGARKDPHYGKTTRDAPYGFVDGTDTPRTEPLYDEHGRAIIPRDPMAYRPGWDPLRGLVRPDETVGADLQWVTQKAKAEKEWGPFGRKKRFMEWNPGATEADWEKHDAEQLEKWKREHQE